jgi:anti-sigma regulatory factor (Ser/Thr protein kinase)
LGTLVAGLGHDMNNVLFPVRCRLDAVSWDNLPEDVQEAAKTARDSVEYLQQLSNGLRLFAADPQNTQSTLDVTSLPTWWGQVEPLITKMVPDNVTIDTSIPDDLPLIAVAPHRLSQTVLNLVTNAAEAMPAGGTIRLEVKGDDRKREVTITVSDEGVGMSEEVRGRALDPFFTTKKRSLSTGLGLSLVLGVVRRAHGSITISSAPGKGTSVCLVFPTARVAEATRQRLDGTSDRAAVTLGDLRTAAWVTNVLESAGYIVSVAEDGDPGDCNIWVTEPEREYLPTARHFLTDHAQRRVIVLGSAPTAWAGLGAVVVEDSSNLDAIKTAVCEVRPVSA